MRQINENKNIENLAKISSSNIKSNGECLTFEEQINKLESGNFPTGDVLIVSPNMKDLFLEKIDNKNLPLIIKQSVIRKALDTHEVKIELLKELPKSIKNNVLILESITRANAYLIFLDEQDTKNREIFVAMHLNKKLDGICINNIASIYGKENLSYLLENTIKLRKKIITNSKTEEWLARTGVSFPERGTTR